MLDFKDYSIKLWQDPTVKKECLMLQNTNGVTVATILYAKWCDMYSLYFNPTVIDFAKQIETDKIIPLRTLRINAIKPSPSYKDAMNAEIQAELDLMQQILTAYPNTPCKEKSAIKNMEDTLGINISI